MSEVNFRLYVITDRHQCQGGQLSKVIEEACASGVKAVQLREKDLSSLVLYQLAEDINKICQAAHAKLFINDRADIAQAVDAHGVQLTSQSLPIHAIRNILTQSKLVGVSTHSLEEAKRAEDEGADFVLFGPVFFTPSKAAFGEPQGLDRLEKIAKIVQVPVFAVGGIDPSRAKQCRENGAFGVAVISAVMGSPNVKFVVQEFERNLGGL
ncbi:MAG: thiamine phosphate synthase [bacterium]